MDHKQLSVDVHGMLSFPRYSTLLYYVWLAATYVSPTLLEVIPAEQ